MVQSEHRTCVRCVMDTTDPDISFDASGVCNHCREFDAVTSKRWFPNEEGETRLRRLAAQIKNWGAGKRYDCILGLSGGLDSSYLGLVVKELGLRPLVVHVDAGWNTDEAVRNIGAVVGHCGFDLYTRTVEWEDVKDLQLAYLKAGVANQDVVQDHAFFAGLYHFAMENDIRYVINGGNIATEAVFPTGWHHSAMDAISIKAIHERYGQRPLKDYPLVSFYRYYVYYPMIKRMSVVRPLNFMPYSKEIALDKLRKIGYLPYDRKHGESQFTRFFQNYYLPVKFNIDKRKAHLSSLIVSGLLTRDEALKKLEEPLYDPVELKRDKQIIADKLEITVEELEGYIYSPGSHYRDYDNWDRMYRLMKQIQVILSKVSGKNLSAYS